MPATRTHVHTGCPASSYICLEQEADTTILLDVLAGTGKSARRPLRTNAQRASSSHNPNPLPINGTSQLTPNSRSLQISGTVQTACCCLPPCPISAQRTHQTFALTKRLVFPMLISPNASSCPSSTRPLAWSPRSSKNATAAVCFDGFSPAEPLIIF